jgi:hypothetical protein
MVLQYETYKMMGLALFGLRSINILAEIIMMQDDNINMKRSFLNDTWVY